MPDPQVPTTIASGVQGGLRTALERLNRMVRKPPPLGVFPEEPAARQPQGTVAAMWMGHQDRQGVGLYIPSAQTQFGAGPEYSNAPERWQIAPWPPNPSLTEENPSGNRTFQIRTDPDFQLGTPPGRIIRYLPKRIWGVDAAASGVPQGSEWDGGSLPFETGWQYMPHYKVVRQALGTKGPQKLADDNAAIPAIYAGNPRP